jgi:hypothetical protein
VKKILAYAMTALLLGVSACSSESGKGHSDSPVLVMTQAGDGIYVIGEDLAAGLWKAAKDVTVKGCVWFVSPAEGSRDQKLPAFDRNTAIHPTITLKDGEGFTTSRCGLWYKVG